MDDKEFERLLAEDTDMAMEMAFLAMTDHLAATAETDRELTEVWEKFRTGAFPADLDDDAPLTLEQAVCLPELGGSYTVNGELRSPSEAVKVKTLRGAIDRGEIDPGWKGKNLFVTRRMIREWLDRCRNEGKKRTSSSGARAGTSKAGSPTALRGSSKMETSLQLALDAAKASMTKRS